MKQVSFLLLSVLILLSTTRCGQTKRQKHERWKPYTQRVEEETCERRKQAGLQGRTAYTKIDSLGTLKMVAIDSFDTDGHLIFNRTLDQEGKAVKEVRHDYADGLLMHTSQLDERGVIHIYYQYSPEGNKLNEYILSSPTDTMLTRKYTYDADGNEVEAEFWRADNNKKAVKKTTYDAEFRPIKVMEYEDERLNWQEQYSYTGKEKLSAERFDGFGTLQKKFEMQFDSAGRCTVMEQFSGQGVSKIKMVGQFDAKGRMLKEETYGGKDLTESTAYTYDERDMVATRRVSAYGMTTEIIFVNRYRK